MKTLRTVFVLGFATLILFGVAYPMAMVGLGKLVPNAAAGLPVFREGTLVGFENIGQPFTGQTYFWSRPSAVEYNAASTGGSNLGPTNPEFLELVKSRIDTLAKYHPEVSVSEIPIELVTASGSGIDPHISKQAALIQVTRVAKNRNLDPARLIELIERESENPLLGLIGPQELVNVLELNLALDELGTSEN